MTVAIWIAAAYVIGAIPTSYLAGRLGRGIDLREHGSRNLGATNVYRVLGWRYAVPVGAFDVTKGAAPVLVAQHQASGSSWMPLAVGLAAVIGHVFSAFVGFKGGKGVATAAGAVGALAPVALAVSAVIWVAVVAATGFVSLGSLLGAAAFPVAVWRTVPHDVPLLVFSGALALFIGFTHRANIARLVAGTENRFGRHRGARRGSA